MKATVFNIGKQVTRDLPEGTKLRVITFERDKEKHPDRYSAPLEDYCKLGDIVVLENNSSNMIGISFASGESNSFWPEHFEVIG